MSNIMILAIIIYYYAPRLKQLSVKRRLSIKQVMSRFVACLCANCLVYFLYLNTPEYKKPYYKIFINTIDSILPYYIAFIFIYFVIYQVYSKDNYCRYDELIKDISHLRLSDNTLQLFLQYFVKAFFIPLMYIFIVSGTKPTFSIKNCYDVYNNIMYFDLLYAVMGYLVSLRLFDTHIISVDTTLSGVLIALVCYPPLNNGVLSHYIAINESNNWVSCGGVFVQFVIIMLSVVYVWATVSFRTNFSNLTYRGLVNTGPYYYFAHPAYISKNIFWWFQKLPLLNADVLGNLIFMVVTNIIYYIRAKTEERHLLQHVEYSRYLNGIRLQRAILVDSFLMLIISQKETMPRCVCRRTNPIGEQ
jgi:protein-S-isoprenylcysteine O-methyltransferase Ste14